MASDGACRADARANPNQGDDHGDDDEEAHDEEELLAQGHGDEAQDGAAQRGRSPFVRDDREEAFGREEDDDRDDGDASHDHAFEGAQHEDDDLAGEAHERSQEDRHASPQHEHALTEAEPTA